MSMKILARWQDGDHAVVSLESLAGRNAADQIG